MALPILGLFLWGMLPAQVPGASPALLPVPATQAVLLGEGAEPERVARLQALVEAAEKAQEADDEATAEARSDEADVLTADWPVQLLNRPDVQALLQRLKEVQEQLDAEADEDTRPGLKSAGEVVTITGEELRAELARVKAAEAGASYDFPIDLNDKVLTWVSQFSSTKRGFMENALGRASRYLPMIRQVFAEEGIPSDLAYLAVIESGFRNEARSRAKAVGMWQFIRSTGRIYGLTANAWVEERRDPVKATRAAARYLKRLYELSGDWYLATSGYNAGPLTLERAIENLGTRNFWDLARSRWLRTETKNYVPELCAAILVGRNPARYGLSIQPLDPYVYETVLVPSRTSLALLARWADTDLASLKLLNPELLRTSTPPGAYTLRVPPGKAIECIRRMASKVPAKEPGSKTYVLRRGDSLVAVARRFKVSAEELLDINQIARAQFKAGRRIQVPSALPQEAGEAPSPGHASGGSRRSPIPLVVVPAIPMTPALDSSAPQGLEPAQAQPSPGPQALPKPPSVASAASGVTEMPPPAAASQALRLEGQILRAAPGDTLARVARAHQVPLGELMRLNPDAVKRLHPGDPIRLPGSRQPQASTGPSLGAKGAVYRVRKGDTLASIARRHGVSIQDLRDWNGIQGGRLLKGQRLHLGPR